MCVKLKLFEEVMKMGMNQEPSRKDIHAFEGEKRPKKKRF